MKVYVINGPSLDLLGIREPKIYGTKTYKDLLDSIKKTAKENNLKVKCFQYDCEGKILKTIKKAYFHHVDAIVINPGAYTHTSIAIHDMLKAVNIPTIEVHLTDINHREEFRKVNYIKDCCIKSFVGKGIDGYVEALKYIAKNVEAK